MRYPLYRPGYVRKLTQALFPHHKGSDTSSFHMMLPTPHLGPGIKAEISTPAPFSSEKPTAANHPNFNSHVSTSQAGHNRQTSLDGLTTCISKDLSTGGRPCLNSGCVNRPIISTATVTSTVQTMRLMALFHQQVSMQTFCHNLGKRI